MNEKAVRSILLDQRDEEGNRAGQLGNEEGEKNADFTGEHHSQRRNGNR